MIPWMPFIAPICVNKFIINYHPFFLFINIPRAFFCFLYLLLVYFLFMLLLFAAIKPRTDNVDCLYANRIKSTPKLTDNHKRENRSPRLIHISAWLYVLCIYKYYK